MCDYVKVYPNTISDLHSELKYNEEKQKFTSTREDNEETAALS